MNFNLRVEKTAVALNLIESDLLDDCFTKVLKEEYSEDYHLIRKRKIKYNDSNLGNMAIIQKVLNNPQFQEILLNCENNRDRIERNLKQYQQEIEIFLQTLIKSELPNIDLDVLIVPWGGTSIFDTNIIIWGHKKGLTDKFYDLVYLYHEAFHKIFQREDISHCIIQWLTDKNLAKYFNADLEDGYPRHEFIEDLQQILEYVFDLYLGKDKKQMLKQCKTDGEKDYIYMIKQIKKDLSKMNMFELEKFLLEHKNIFQNVLDRKKNNNLSV